MFSNVITLGKVPGKNQVDHIFPTVQQVIEMTNIQTNILNGLMDAFASIISNNLNGIMKFLASITIVLSLPTMVASYYGMNVNLPLEEHPHAFPLVLGICLAISITAAVIFYKRDWF
jgi:magnesium transporter